MDVQRNLKKLRTKIDEIDNKILDLLNERAKVVIDVGKTKAVNNLDFYVPAREQEIFERLTKTNQGPFPKEALRSVFREIISASLSLEQPLKVAFLGPQATFTHIASIQQFGLSANYLPFLSIDEVFEEVERGGADFGVVPVENSTEGVVSHTLDMFVNSNLKIFAEILIEISHDLLSKSGKTQDIKAVYSHPHALAQCRKWLGKNLPGVPLYDVASTALAAQTAANDINAAAVASQFAGFLYDLKVVKKKIEDNINNFTRFLVIGKKSPGRSGLDRTSIMFSIKDAAGALYKVLAPFAECNVNLTKIESRPLKEKAWEYVFFIDLEGHIEDKNVAKAIEMLKTNIVFLKILGSYPKQKS